MLLNNDIGGFGYLGDERLVQALVKTLGEYFSLDSFDGVVALFEIDSGITLTVTYFDITYREDDVIFCRGISDEILVKVVQ